MGDFQLRRSMGEDILSNLPETFNVAVEELAEYAGSLERKFSEMVVHEQRQYWATIVSVFGVFASVIALIVKSVSVPSEATASQLVPLALVLAVFVVALRFVIPTR